MNLQAPDIVTIFKAAFNEGIIEANTVISEDGYIHKKINQTVYIHVTKDIFYRAINLLKKITLSSIDDPIKAEKKSGSITLTYSFLIKSGNGIDIPVKVSVTIHGENLSIPSISNLFPAIALMENRIQETTGIEINNITSNYYSIISNGELKK